MSASAAAAVVVMSGYGPGILLKMAGLGFALLIVCAVLDALFRGRK